MENNQFPHNPDEFWEWFAGIFDQVRREYAREILDSKSEDHETREQLYQESRVVNRVQQKVRAYINAI